MNINSFRILCIGELWLGSNALAAFTALRRLRHSVHMIDECQYTPPMWHSIPARIARRLLRPLLVRELFYEARRQAAAFRPHGVFVFKGYAVHAKLIEFYRNRGIPTVNFYPDVSFSVHGPYIPQALPIYSHVFTTKSWGVSDMQAQLGLRNVSFLEHGFDPDIHRPFELSEEDRARYGCDVVFIGTWSPKKEKLLFHLKRTLPEVRLRIWGCQWEKISSPELDSSVVGDGILGEEYSKVLQASSICLGILSERRQGASSGDLITSRTFNIPACGAFLLHERNEESVRYFKEDQEAAFFGSPEELVERVRFYLNNPVRRSVVAKQGRDRCLNSGYSIDARMGKVANWFQAHFAANPIVSVETPI